MNFNNASQTEELRPLGTAKMSESAKTAVASWRLKGSKLDADWFMRVTEAVFSLWVQGRWVERKLPRFIPLSAR